MTVDVAKRVRQNVLKNNLEGPVADKSVVLNQKLSSLLLRIEKLKECAAFVQKDTRIYFENTIDRLKNTFKHETADYVSRIEYYEQEVREINGLISYFNTFLDSSIHFELLVIYPKMSAKFDELDDRQHGSRD